MDIQNTNFILRPAINCQIMLLFSNSGPATTTIRSFIPFYQNFLHENKSSLKIFQAHEMFTFQSYFYIFPLKEFFTFENGVFI
jgi:hypothetical protein